jgi:hypothetical protein
MFTSIIRIRTASTNYKRISPHRLPYMLGMYSKFRTSGCSLFGTRFDKLT